MSSPAAIPDAFADPEHEGAADVLFLAGERSGSEHAARVIADLRKRRPDLRIAAFGGAEMEAAGAQLLFDMTCFSAVGLVEVLAHYGFYKTLFARVFAWIKKHRPRTICLVDYPGFNLRLAERLRSAGLSRKGGGEITLCYYISPQIWAWKPRRRFKMAKVLDSVGVIFPFETECYGDTSLDVCFVGHPFVAPSHTAPLRYEIDAPVLLLPGSRPKAVRRIFPAMLAAWRQFLATHPGREAVVIHTGGTLQNILRSELTRFPDLAKSVRLKERDTEPQCASAALTSSGTMSLSLALAGIPGAVVYRANPLTWFVGRMLVKGVKYLGIANILLDRPAWPEYLQGDATPAALATRLSQCVDSPAAAFDAQDDAAALHTLLGGTNEIQLTPTDWLLEWSEP